MRSSSLLMISSLFLPIPAVAQESGIELVAAAKKSAGAAPAPAPAEVKAAPVEKPKTAAAVGTDATRRAGPAESASLPMIGVAPRIGLTIPSSKLGAFVIAGLSADYYLPVLNNQLSVGLDLAWSRPGYPGRIDDRRVGGSHDYDIAVNQLKVALDVIYRVFPHAKMLNFYGGIGLGMLLMQAKEDAPFISGKQKQQSTEFAFDLLAGVDYKIGPGLVFGELRYAYASLGYELTGDTNAGHFDISGGYRLTF